MQLSPKPEATVEAYRLTPQNIEEIMNLMPIMWLIERDNYGNEMDALDRCLKMRGANERYVSAKIGDWVLRDHLGQISFETNQTIKDRFNLPDAAYLDSMALDDLLAQRDRFEPQYGLTEDQTRMVANLQALKKLYANKMASYAFPFHAGDIKSWFPEGGQTISAGSMADSDVLRAMREHFASRARLIAESRGDVDAAFSGWQNLSNNEQEKYIARVLKPSRIIDAPDAHDLVYVRNVDLLASVIRPGSQIGPRRLTEFRSDIAAWNWHMNDGDDTMLPMSQSYVESVSMDLALRRVRNQCVEHHGNDAYSSLSPEAYELLLGEEIQKFAPDYREVDGEQMSRPRG